MRVKRWVIIGILCLISIPIIPENDADIVIISGGEITGDITDIQINVSGNNTIVKIRRSFS
jgi:hypothetical protein